MLKNNVLFLVLFLIPVTAFLQDTVSETISCPLLPANNIWNTPVDTLPVDANSSKYINTIGADDYVHADFGSGLWDGGPIGIPFVTVPGNQPKVNISFYYDDESDPGPYPIPADAPIEGGSNSDGDRHVLVVDRDNCILYEIYDAHPQGNGSWTAGSGAIFDLNSNDLRPETWTSADAAGLPILPGLVRYEEVAAGEINHAIRFTAPQTQKKYVWPARHYASSLTAAKYPPMGQRFRLKANYDISGFSADVQVILRALKKYGMILADNGSSWFITGAPDERWDNDVLHELHQVEGSNFEAVDVSSLMVHKDSGAVNTGTSEQPTISLDRDRLNAGVVLPGTSTGAQVFSINNSGEGTLNWTVSGNAGWLDLSPASGSGPGAVSVSIDTSGLSAGSYTGAISVSDSNATNSPQTVTVDLTVKTAAQDQPPFGSFDGPLNGAVVSSSVPVTGWALDDTGVESVKIYRQAGNQRVYIGDAVFVEGARNDIETAYPGYPNHYKAGWGYMMLTNFLPNGGNGTFTLTAAASDPAGHETTLGSTTITCDNANAVKPFGAIDTPEQGGTASGSSFRNHGWVLTPLPNAVPTDGSTIDVYVDGVNLGHPVYNIYRSDVASLFPGYANSDGAAAYFDLAATAYDNGVHTIAWSATDDAGNTDGIGSRYFTVLNAGSTRRSGIRGKGSGVREGVRDKGENLGPVWVKRGFGRNAETAAVYPDDEGKLMIKIAPVERVVISLYNEEIYENPQQPGAVFRSPLNTHHSTLKNPSHNVSRGYLTVGSSLRHLPVGSTFDAVRGVFYWQPGPGFAGDYEFLFIATAKNGKYFTRNITIRIGH